MAVLDRVTRPLILGAPITVGARKYRVREIVKDDVDAVAILVAAARRRKTTHAVAMRSYTYDTHVGLYRSVGPTSTRSISRSTHVHE